MKQIGFVPVNPGPLLAVLNASPADPDAVAKAITRCPSLAARLLSVTNSAAFGLRQPIDTVRRAVLHLGGGRARSLALAFGLRAVHEGIGLDEPWLSQLWIASLRKACAAQLAGELIDPAHAEKAFCLGLVQDVALPLLVNLDPHFYQRDVVPAGQGAWCQLERERFGIDHIELSMRLLRSWDADVDLRQAVHRHHQPPDLPAERDGDDEPAAGANARVLMSVPLYLASLVPHFDEELSSSQREWLVALHGSFLAPAYASPDAFYQATSERAAPLHADRPDPMPPREQLTAAL
ncbi:MAG: HDOD domain-containing protein, partial [Phycisphaeraceae bacterium]